MRKNTFKSIISLFLVIFLLIPNITAAAVEINNVVQADMQENKENEVSLPEVEKVDEEAMANDNEVKTDNDNVGKVEETTEVEPEKEINAAKDAVKNEVNNTTNKEVENIEEKSGDAYEVTKKPQTYSLGGQGLSESELEREEVKGKLQAISEMEYLVPKTDSNYEIAIANADGSYNYIASANTIDEAKLLIENMPMMASDNDALPSIINANGQVVYSTNAMYKMPATSGNIDLYTDASLSKAFTYVNSGYVEDAPIIEESSNAYKIEVAGFTGWISKAVANEVVPMNQVTNPSYYKAQGGVLYHFISYDLKSTANKGYTLKLGPAPSYLAEGVKYFSYDGNYFYNGSDYATGLNNVVSDLRNGTHNQSVNRDNPHYLYFNYLPFRSTTVYTATELNSFINANTDPSSKLRGIGDALIKAQNSYGVNAVLSLAVAINESGWGMSAISQAKNNLFGIKAFDTNPGESADSFNTPGDSVIEFAKNYISRGYADPADWRYQGGFLGNKYKGANVKYASDPFWGEKAAQWAHKIDYELSSSNMNNLRDHNMYQIALYKANNQVKNSSGTLLYNVTNNQAEYAGYHDTPLILKTGNVVSKNGADCYEMYPERHTPVNAGGPSNKFSGNYNWDANGYVYAKGMQFINDKKIIKKGTVGYQTHIEDYAWQNWKYDGDRSGTTGESKRVEGIRIELGDFISGASIEYRTHVEDHGWMSWKGNGELSGTTGEGRRLEGIQIVLKNAPGYSVQYRTHVQDYGWMPWKANGEVAGTVGEGRRLEAIEIRVVKDPNYNAYYRTHVEDYGWLGFRNSNETSGTVNEAKRLEAIEINLHGAPEGASISYQTHVQDYGWMNWKYNGQMAGTVGEGRRMEAIKIVLENAPGFKVEYRVHVQDIGWQDWRSDGQIAGTEGKSKRLEAIEIRIVKK